MKTRSPTFVEPMKAKAVTAVPAGDWRLEIKFDGYRVLAVLQDRRVELWSRNRKRWADRFGEITEALAELSCRDAVLDGEIVALDERGRSSFQLLQNLLKGGKAVPLRYYVFDLLRWDGEDFMARPLEERQAELAKRIRRAKGRGRQLLALSPVFAEEPRRLLAAARKQGLEGIVAKAAGSRYEPGRRSGAWLKCRIVREQEFVIGGFTAPKGTRKHFGALLVGYFDPQDRFTYAGKVGTGFDAATLRELGGRLARTERKGPAFAAGEVPATIAREAHWVSPRLVAQVKFAEWTDDGRLRQPAFVGLREDKPVHDVRREALAER